VPQQKGEKQKRAADAVLGSKDELEALLQEEDKKIPYRPKIMLLPNQVLGL